MSADPNTAPIPDHEQEQARRSRTAEVVARVLHTHTRLRLNHNAKIIERDNHQTALYTDLGRQAVSGQVRISETAMQQRRDSGEPAMQPGEFLAESTIHGGPALPRTASERRKDRKIARRAHKKSTSDTYVYQTLSVYRGRDYAQNAINNGISVAELQPGLGIARPGENLFLQQHNGKITAEEARQQRIARRAEPREVGIGAMVSDVGRQNKAARKLEKATKQGVLASVQTKRARRAQERITGLHEKYVSNVDKPLNDHTEAVLNHVYATDLRFVSPNPKVPDLRQAGPTTADVRKFRDDYETEQQDWKTEAVSKRERLVAEQAVIEDATRRSEQARKESARATYIQKLHDVDATVYRTIADDKAANEAKWGDMSKDEIKAEQARIRAEVYRNDDWFGKVSDKRVAEIFREIRDLKSAEEAGIPWDPQASRPKPKSVVRGGSPRGMGSYQAPVYGEVEEPPESELTDYTDK